MLAALTNRAFEYAVVGMLLACLLVRACLLVVTLPVLPMLARSLAGLEKKPNLKSSWHPALTRATIYNVNVFA